MPAIYQGEVWCDGCANNIRRDIMMTTPEKVPDNPEDETSYDSEDWPKEYDPDEASDGPQNCADGECGGLAWIVGKEAGVVASTTYGKFLENALTEEGYAYLQRMLNEHGEVLSEFAQEWADYYGFTWHGQSWGNPIEWLRDKISDLWPLEGEQGLWNIIESLLRMVDSDQIQNEFQEEMKDSGYFRKPGWYREDV